MIFSGLAVFLLVARYTHSWLAARKGRVFSYALAFTDGVRSLNRRTALPILSITAVIWALELTMLQGVLHAFRLTVDLVELVVLGSSLTLSTIAPTPPGFLGSFQFVGGTLMESFGLGRATGLSVVTSVQVFCYLPIALFGVVVGIVRWYRLLAFPHSKRCA